MTTTFSIAGRRIGPDTSPFIIAEMSGNHNQSLDRALALVNAAADAGAHAIKLQTYMADTITMPGASGFRLVAGTLGFRIGIALAAGQTFVGLLEEGEEILRHVFADDLVIHLAQPPAQRVLTATRDP